MSPLGRPEVCGAGSFDRPQDATALAPRERFVDVQPTSILPVTGYIRVLIMV